WLRVTSADPGCTLYAGARPEDALLADPGSDRLRLEALDWDQAWADSGVTGRAGLLPDLVDTAPLPRNRAVRVLDFRLPAGVDPARVRRALPKLRTATGNDYLQTQPSAAGTLRLLVATDNPLPDLAPFNFTAADRDDKIPFAVGVDGEVVAYDPALDPHLLLAGLTGAGKSCLAQGLVYGALIRGWQVYLVDPVKGGADYHFARNHCHAVAATPSQAAAALRAVYTEITARKQRNAAHGVGSTRDLPDPPPNLLVLIDEFTSLVGRDPVPPRTGDPHLDTERDIIEAANHAKIEIGVYAGKIAREARSAGVTLALGTQKLSAKMLDTIPGAGDLKVNLSRVLLGKTSWGDRASALRSPDDAPDLDGTIPRGRGLWETTAHPAHIIQTWYASQDDFRANLETRAPELPSTERLALRAEGPHVDACPGHGSKGQTADAIPSTLDLGDIDLSLTDLEAACAKDPAGVPLADRPDLFDDGFGPPGPRSRAATANQHQWDLDS
ncbi:MAG TPA: FtsK/SpoIIIE domain-containing protein, partial [Nakamurella sp.]